MNEDHLRRFVDHMRRKGFGPDRRLIVKTLCSKPDYADHPRGRKSGVRLLGQPFEIEAYVTRPEVDLEREVVLSTGLEFDGYLKQNGTFVVDHCYDLMSCIGKLRWVKRFHDGIKMRSALVGDPANPLQRQTMALASNASIGHSIGMEVHEWGPPKDKAEEKAYPGAESFVRRATVYEVSYTGMPMLGSTQSEPQMEEEEAREGSKALMFFS